MTQQAVGEFAEAPLISPTEATEDEMWDALEYEDAPPVESPGDESPEPGTDEEDPEDSGGEPGGESPGEQPASEADMRQQRAQWAAAVAIDPSAIQQVPRRQRKAILAAADVVKPAAWSIAQPMAERIAEQRYWQMIQLHEKTQELDALAEDDPQLFRQVLANPERHGFSDEVVGLWRRAEQWRENGGPPGAPQQGQNGSPQQQRQPQVDPGVSRWQTRATAVLDEFAEEFGEGAVGEVVAWLQEEGLTVVKTAQEAESGYKALRQRLDAERAKRNGGPPPQVQRRRTLARPDVSPGRTQVGGRASREDIYRRAFSGSESDAWAAT